MQQFKIDNFLRDNPGAKPPEFVPLTDSEVVDVASRLVNAAGRPGGTPEEIIRLLNKNAVPLERVNLDEEELSLQEVFKKAGIHPAQAVYVEWGALRDIDRFRTDDLERHFYDVWYASADDIEIFDESFGWLMFIRHYGGVEIWHPRRAG